MQLVSGKNPVIFINPAHSPDFVVVGRYDIAVSTLDEASAAADFLANFYPEPERVRFGIHELAINAVEHGNLGIGYDLKTELVRQGKWLDEVERRRNLPHNINKKAHIRFRRYSDNISLTISDCGNGFDWRKYLEISPEQLTANHGRGIAIAAAMSFDSLDYAVSGSEVICKVALRE